MLSVCVHYKVKYDLLFIFNIGFKYFFIKGKKTTKAHKSGIGHLNSMKRRILDDFNSARELTRREGDRVN